MKKLKVLVVCGGRSAERSVSLVSAKFVYENLDRSRYEPRLVFIDPKGRWLKADPRLLSGKVAAAPKAAPSSSRDLVSVERLAESPQAPDVVFPVLHGPFGEDGTVQGLLELAGLPYVGCGVLGSSVGMDKEATKRLAAAAGLPVLPYLTARPGAVPGNAVETLGLPLFVKPARLGSSVGITKVKAAKDLAGALKTAFRYDDKVLLEKGVAAREIECAVLGDPWSSDPKDELRLAASVCGEIVPNAEFYDYKAKYLDPDGAELLIPAKLAPAESEAIREMALSAFRALDGYGMARVDFLWDKASGRPYFNEINTIPGFTPISMYPMLWKASGLDAQALLDRLVKLALRRHAARARLAASP